MLLDWRLSWGLPGGDEADGQLMFIFILSMAAAEVAVGLALILQFYIKIQHPGCRCSQQIERITCWIYFWTIVALTVCGIPDAGFPG